MAGTKDGIECKLCDGKNTLHRFKLSDGSMFMQCDTKDCILHKSRTLDKNSLQITDIVEPIIELPPGIVRGCDLDFKAMKEQVVRSIPIPWPGLNAALNGFEYGCFYLLLAGTSTGKSTVLRELVYYYRKRFPDLKIANFFFEENEQVTPLAYLALDLQIPLGLLRRNIASVPQDKFEKALSIIDSDKLFFIKKDFKRDANVLLPSIEHLVTKNKVDLIVIDHLSYIIGRTGVGKHGERRDIDEFIYKLQDLVQRLGCIIIGVSHVNESDSTKRWDQGEVPNIYSGRGSKALAQVPDGIIGLARNIATGFEKSILGIYNLKNRWHSETGKTDELIYMNDTGRSILNYKMDLYEAR